MAAAVETKRDGRGREASEIAGVIADRVRRGQYRVDEAYPSERQLCEEFDVGRPVIREVMVRLSQAGFAVLETGHRPRVARPMLRDLLSGVGATLREFFPTSEGRAHLEQVRLFLETGLVRYAAKHATPAQIAQLHEALKANERMIGQVGAFRSSDVAFHAVLAQIPGNPIFPALHAAFVERMIIGRPVVPDAEARTATSFDEHRQIFEAVVDRDAERAVDVMDRHLTRAYNEYFHDILAEERAEPSASAGR